MAAVSYLIRFSLPSKCPLGFVTDKAQSEHNACSFGCVAANIEAARMKSCLTFIFLQTGAEEIRLQFILDLFSS